MLNVSTVPMSPYLALKLDGKIFDIPVNYLTSFQCTRTTDKEGEFSFIINDTNDLLMESKLLGLLNDQNKGVSFQYGWVDGPTSPWYYGWLQDYNPTFFPDMAMSFECKGIITETGLDSHVKYWKGKRASDIVAKIAAFEGWAIGDIDSSDPFDEEREYTQSNEYSVDFIRKQIEPVATVKGSPMMFYLHVDANGPKVYFVKYNKYKSIVKENFKFIINGGNESNVIEFAPTYTGASLKASIGQQMAFMDMDTKEVSVYAAEGQVVDGTELNVYGAMTKDRMSSMIANKWFGKNIGAFKASLRIVGTPYLNPLDYINILPVRPDGTLHYTRGTYLIKTVTDSIQGSWVTTLDLIQDSKDKAGELMDMSEVVKFGGIDT